MNATYYLSAHFHQRDLDAVKELLGSALSAPGARACYIGGAHDDDPRWAKRVSQQIEKALGLEVATPRLSDKKLDLESARAAIEDATYLFLDGGDTVGLADHARARGLLPAFAKAAKRAKVIHGISAGACAISAYTIGYDDEGNGLVAPCLDMGFPLPLDVHDEPDWDEMRALLELVKKRKDLPQEGVVIPTASALIILPNGELRSKDGAPPCEKRSLARDGSWKVQAIAAIEEARVAETERTPRRRRS